MIRLAPLLFVAACASAPTAMRTVQVAVPVATACVPASLPAAPGYPDTDHALVRAPDAAERYRLLIIGREIRIARIGVLEALVEACK